LAKFDVRKNVVMGKKIKEYCRNYIWGFLIILLFISPLTVGAGGITLQDEQTDSITAPDKLRTKVTLNYIDTPIQKVLSDLAKQAKIDIIKSPKVVGDVTVKLTDIPLEEALTNILSLYYCTYIATENMIRVVKLPPNTRMKEPQVTRIYKITYADPNEVYAAMKKFISGKGEVGFNKGTSHIVVTDTEDKIRGIDKFIEQIDRITPQVLVEVRIYDVSTREGFELSPDWHVGRNAPYIPGIIKEKTETVRGPESSIFEQKRTDRRWMEARRRIWIDAAQDWFTVEGWPDPCYTGVPGGAQEITPIWERTETGVVTEPGREDTETRYIDYSGIADRRRKPFVSGSFDRTTGGTLHVSLLNDAIDLDFVLSVLHSQVDAKLLANPRILVLDNETADFEIVREIPFRGVRQVPREDPITYTAFKNVGIDLKVTPHIARDGMLKLHIVPEFSVLVGFDMFGAPTIDNRSADTKAMIKDGQTIAIGGLRKREVTKDLSKVPVFGDLPLVGGMFRSETESIAIKELIVFITTKIVTDPTLSESEKKLLGETEFETPQIEKTRIEKGQFDNTKAEDSDITDSLDLLMKKLGSSGEGE
jgi:type II secretory pathway component GspD/PulD (secretin)